MENIPSHVRQEDDKAGDGDGIVGMLLPPHFPQLLQKQEPPAHASGSGQSWGALLGFQEEIPVEAKAGLTSLEATKQLLSQEAFLAAEVSVGVCCSTPPGASREQEFWLLPQPALVMCVSPAFFPSEVSSQQLLSSWMQFGTSSLVALSFYYTWS